MQQSGNSIGAISPDSVKLGSADCAMPCSDCMGQTADATQLLANAWPERQMAKSQKSQVLFTFGWYGNPIQAERLTPLRA